MGRASYHGHTAYRNGVGRAAPTEGGTRDGYRIYSGGGGAGITGSLTGIGWILLRTCPSRKPTQIGELI